MHRQARARGRVRKRVSWRACAVSMQIAGTGVHKMNSLCAAHRAGTVAQTLLVVTAAVHCDSGSARGCESSVLSFAFGVEEAACTNI